MTKLRHDGRKPEQLREIRIKRRYTRPAPGSVLIQSGRTTVLCTASVENQVPPWLVGKGRGWVTAEYNMLPGSTSPRKRRERDGKVDGRTTEIQRLIGRSLRAVIDLAALGERTITIDCDVLEADGEVERVIGVVRLHLEGLVVRLLGRRPLALLGVQIAQREVQECRRVPGDELLQARLRRLRAGRRAGG